MGIMVYINSDELDKRDELIKSLQQRNCELAAEIEAAHTALLNSRCDVEFDISKQRHMLGLTFTDQEVKYDKWFVEHMLLRVRGHLRSYENKMKAKDPPRAEVKYVDCPSEESLVMGPKWEHFKKESATGETGRTDERVESFRLTPEQIRAVDEAWDAASPETKEIIREEEEADIRREIEADDEGVERF